MTMPKKIPGETYNIALILDIDMAIDSVNDLFTGNKVRGHSLALSIHKPRFPLIFLSESNKEYHIYIKRDSNRMDEDEPIPSTGNSQDKYIIQERKKGQVSKTANSTDNICHQQVSNEDPASSFSTGNNVFNIQLNYDIDQALDPELWDGKFHAVSLHESIEYLASDIKNIKKSLCRMENYIKDKSVNSNPNNVKDLESIGKVVWEFLSTIYDIY